MSEEPRSTKALPPAKKVVFSFVAALIVLVATELLGRAAWHLRFDEGEDRRVRAFFGLGGGWDPNVASNFLPHHYLVYSLNPEASWSNAEVDGGRSHDFVNELGYRGEPLALEKPPGVFRIVCIGGSTTFGINQAADELTYPSQLEAILTERFSSPRFEVVNAGTPGWTSAESLVNFQFRVLELSPDAVVSYDGVNDTFAMRARDEGRSDYSNFRRIVRFPTPGPLTRHALRASAFVRFAYYGWYGPENIAFDINRLAIRPTPVEFLGNLDRATGKYFRRNTESLVAIARANEVLPVLVTMGHGEWHPSLARTAQIYRQVAEKTGARLVDFEPLSRDEFFTEDRVHLTGAGNAALAAAVAEEISRVGAMFVPRSAGAQSRRAGTLIVPE
ncbi:MAG: SGNH/GDSL hydrolase family protein [Deltaproteobacteria bacterium]|nr:SGNH/GDSL hydrolase family protein [Deltaproteobacteria bacterium]